MAYVSEVNHLKYRSTLYGVEDGFHYQADKSDDRRVFLRCVRRGRGCKGRASMPLLPDQRLVVNFRTKMRHNHGPDHIYVQVLELRKKILERCATEATEYKRIFEEECYKVPDEVSCQMSYCGLTSAMTRARRYAKGKSDYLHHRLTVRHKISGEGGEESLKSGETPCDSENVQSEEPATSLLVSKEDQNNETVEENAAKPMENMQNVEESPSQESTTAEKSSTQTNSSESAADAPEEPNSNESDFTNLKSVVKKLEVIHDKLSLIASGDSCDQFGKYVSSLLRGLPPKKVLSLKQKIVTDVLDVLLAHERGLSENVLSIGTDSPSNQKKTTNPVANRPFTYVDSNDRDADDPLYTPLKDNPRNSRSNNHAVVKPKPPQVQKLVNIEETCLPPLVPINSCSPSTLRLMPMLPFPANTLPPVFNPAAGNQMPRCETMPSSYDGTPLLHLKLPTRDSPTAGSGSVTNTSTKSRRGRKRKQMPSTEAVDWNKPEEEEFKIDIEEGKELLGMKQDLETFETVVCGSDLVEVKQEAPDPEDECEGSPPHQEYLVLEPTRLYLCDICSEQCATMTDLTTHFTQQHSGCVPIFKDQSEESILPSAKKQCI